MAEKKSLGKLFEDLYSLEKSARDYYNDLLTRLSDEEQLIVVAKIRDDEEEHMKAAQLLIEIVKNEN